MNLSNEDKSVENKEAAGCFFVCHVCQKKICGKFLAYGDDRGDYFGYWPPDNWTLYHGFSDHGISDIIICDNIVCKKTFGKISFGDSKG